MTNSRAIEIAHEHYLEVHDKCQSFLLSFLGFQTQALFDECFETDSRYYRKGSTSRPYNIIFPTHVLPGECLIYSSCYWKGTAPADVLMSHLSFC